MCSLHKGLTVKFVPVPIKLVLFFRARLMLCLLSSLRAKAPRLPGFLSAWLELPGMAERFAEWSDVVGLDLVRYGTTADAEEIRDTAVAQPLLVSAGIAAAIALFGDLESAAASADVVAGHSVGEFTAAAVAGALTPRDALLLVAERGPGDGRSVRGHPDGYDCGAGRRSGRSPAAIKAAGLTPANDNGSGQIVAAGTLEQLEALR